MAMTLDPVVLRPLAIGGVVLILGSLLAAAPIPAAGSLIGYLAGGLVIFLGWSRSRLGRRHFGAANVITLARVVGTGWILAWILQAALFTPIPLIAVCIAVVGAVCLALDGVDGHVARARHETSTFGARFDIEADSATALLLAIAVMIFGIAGWWVLLIGLLRYGYVLAGRFLPALQTPLPFSQSRRMIGVGQAILLVMALLIIGVFPDSGWVSWLWLLPAISLTALLWSFGRDVVGQLRSSAAA